MLDLRIVDAEDVHPHEIADPARQERIERRLRADGVLRDPLTVGAVREVRGYVLLDGTNRKRALATLGLPRAMVQIIDYADQSAVQLCTWCHAARRTMSDLLERAGALEGMVVSSLPPLATADALNQPKTIAVLLDRRDRFALCRSVEHEASRTVLLRRLVNLYEDRMNRVECDPDELEVRAQTPAPASDEGLVLVAFPPFSRSQVVSMAMGGTLIPAGITRHVILSGRALRVNLPLELLDGSRDLEQVNAALQKHVSGLQPRLYQEPTILFDS